MMHPAVINLPLFIMLLLRPAIAGPIFTFSGREIIYADVLLSSSV